MAHDTAPSLDLLMPGPGDEPEDGVPARVEVPAGDVTALAEAMGAYCLEPGLSIRHGAESLRISEEFTPGRNAERFEEALRSLQELGSQEELAGLRR